jgi:hypothetical protein
MSDKAYFVSVKTNAEMQMFRRFLIEFKGQGFCSYIAKTTKKLTGCDGGFSKGQLVAALTIDRSDLRDAYVNEGNICNHSNMPSFATIYDIPSDSTGKPLHIKIEPDHKQKEYAEILIGDHEAVDDKEVE